MSVSHSLILSLTHTHKLVERPHFLGTSGIEVKIKSVLKNFWYLVLKFTTPRYTLLFLNFEIYIVHVIICEWSRFVNFPLHMFCIQTCIFPTGTNSQRFVSYLYSLPYVTLSTVQKNWSCWQALITIETCSTAITIF